MDTSDMDEATKLAGEDLAGMVGRFKQEPSDAITTYNELQRWWREWYLSTGHKRLGRLLLNTK